MNEILGDTPDEIKILLEIALPIGTCFEVVENFQGKCFERRRAMAEQEEPRTKFERLPESSRKFFAENALNMTFENGAEFANKITEILVLWAEAREKQGKKFAEVQRRKQKFNEVVKQRNERYFKNLGKLEAWAAEKCDAHFDVNIKYAEYMNADASQAQESVEAELDAADKSKALEGVEAERDETERDEKSPSIDIEMAEDSQL